MDKNSMGDRNEVSPLDMELAAETRRILNCLDISLDRIKYAGLLALLLKDDGFLLSDALEADDLFYALHVCKKYDFNTWSANSLIGSTVLSVSSNSFLQEGSNISMSEPSLIAASEKPDTPQSVASFNSAVSSPKKDEKSLKLLDKIDIDLSKVICLLEDNPKVKQLVQDNEEAMSAQIKLFIRCLTEIRNSIEQHMGETVTEAKARENHLRECYMKNEIAKKEIASFEEELASKKGDTNACVIGKNILITRHQNKINKLKKIAQEQIEKRIKESEKAMVLDYRSSQARQEMLKEEVEAATQKFNDLLKEHLAAEKVLRIKRAKVENQLVGWLQKFDQDIGDKQVEEEELQAGFDEEKKILEDLQAQYDEQEEEYDELMQEKAEYDQMVLEQKLFIFIMNRSARRIQRAWRAYKNRKMAKKKAKKGKKGKKK